MSADPGNAQIRPLSAKVEALAGFGILPGDIALVTGLAEDELRQTYGVELDSGAIKANARVAENLFRRATGEGREAVTAGIFWLKARARWKETHVLEHSGGNPESPVRIVLSYEDQQL